MGTLHQNVTGALTQGYESVSWRKTADSVGHLGEPLEVLAADVELARGHLANPDTANQDPLLEFSQVSLFSIILKCSFSRIEKVNATSPPKSNADVGKRYYSRSGCLLFEAVDYRYHILQTQTTSV